MPPEHSTPGVDNARAIGADADDHILRSRQDPGAHTSTAVTASNVESPKSSTATTGGLSPNPVVSVPFKRQLSISTRSELEPESRKCARASHSPPIQSKDTSPSPFTPPATATHHGTPRQTPQTSSPPLPSSDAQSVQGHTYLHKHLPSPPSTPLKPTNVPHDVQGRADDDAVTIISVYSSDQESEVVYHQGDSRDKDIMEVNFEDDPELDVRLIDLVNLPKNFAIRLAIRKTNKDMPKWVAYREITLQLMTTKNQVWMKDTEDKKYVEFVIGEDGAPGRWVATEAWDEHVYNPVGARICTLMHRWYSKWHQRIWGVGRQKHIEEVDLPKGMKMKHKYYPPLRKFMIGLSIAPHRTRRTPNAPKPAKKQQ